jgi:HD-like signal output (HDOD) protein
MIATATPATNHLEEIASRAVALYSRPSIAMELVRLAEDPSVDAEQLKQCISHDPALTSKLLRVVNSSLYGLHRPVGDLNQAIGLLGIKPLKLLVLGFSLPDSLFAEVAARELRWYWTNTLTRAVAARLLAEQLWNEPGDEAFIAGLLQDIGILVLLRELGEPYARFLTGVIDERCHLASLEHDTLGFDHIQLSAALLARWQLPQRLVDAIALPKRLGKLSRLESREGALPQVLHLADMLVQLVGQGRLQVLPELLEAGKVYRGMTKSKLTTLVENLQPPVDKLSQALALELTENRDYEQTLLAAHEKMAALSEQIAGATPEDAESVDAAEDRAVAQLLGYTRELSTAVRRVLNKNRVAAESHEETKAREPAIRFRKSKTRASAVEPMVNMSAAALVRKLLAAASLCRDRRQELSLLVIEPDHAEPQSRAAAHLAALQTRRALGRACEIIGQEHTTLISLGERRTIAILPNCERQAAVALAHRTIAELGQLEAYATEAAHEGATMLGIGIATAGVVHKNFDPARMIERALRCLSAAHACGISAVKSIEV